MQRKSDKSENPRITMFCATTIKKKKSGRIVILFAKRVNCNKLYLFTYINIMYNDHTDLSTTKKEKREKKAKKKKEIYYCLREINE